MLLPIFLSYKKYWCYLRQLREPDVSLPQLFVNELMYLSSLDSEYTFLFLGTNPFFVSIAWSHSFPVGILSLCFFPNMWIHLWKHSNTNFFASFSDFATSFSLFYISHSSAIFFTSTILSFLEFFLFLTFFFFHSFSASFFSSFSFCFYHPNFPYFGLHCFLYSSRHLIIFIFVLGNGSSLHLQHCQEHDT